MPRDRNYRALARRFAKQYGINPDYFENQIGAESGFNPNARSPVGATGIAQIMPATARGWGVDPNDPVASLRAAAKNMAQYVKKYGSYENALRAYNAGPGAIEASKGYAETNAYVKKILGSSRDAGNDVVTTSRESSTGSPGTSLDASDKPSLFDTIRRMNVGQDEEEDNGIQSTVDTLLRLRGDGSSPSSRAPATSDAAPSTPSLPASGGDKKIYELFYDPQGGWKGTQNIGPIGGHGDHGHFAADPRRTLWVGNQLKKRFGVRVSENPAFDPVDPVHAENSHHYRTGKVRGKTVGEAIDFSGPRMADAVRWIRRKYGLK